MSRVLNRSGWLMGGLLLAFATGFCIFAISISRFDARAPAEGDAVVVLTGGELRVREGLRLFAEGAGRRLLISGVNRATSKDDLRKFAGVTPILFDCCVDVGYVALDTIGNASEARQWLQTWGFRRLIVVTSNYHMPRSLMEFGRALPNVELVPHVVVSKHYQGSEWWRHPGAIKRVVTEYVKFLPAAGKWLVSKAVQPASTPALSEPVGPGVSSPGPRLTGL